MRSNGTVVATWTNALLQVAHRAGLRLEPLLAETCIDLQALGSPEARLPFEVHAQVFRRVPVLLDDPGIGLDVGLETEADAMGLVGLLAERLVDGPPPLAHVARALGTSVRSLQRQLAARGLSYSEIIDGARRERARELLSVRGTSVDAIALALGYEGARPFRRACLRWFGHPPSMLRGAR